MQSTIAPNCSNRTKLIKVYFKLGDPPCMHIGLGLEEHTLDVLRC
jgi:hypothetical protein